MKKLAVVLAVVLAAIATIKGADFAMKKYFEHLSDEKLKQAIASELIEGTEYDTVLIYKDENGITHYEVYDLVDDGITVSDDLGYYQISMR